MSPEKTETDEVDEDDDARAENDTADDEVESEEAPEKLHLDVNIETVSACERHVTVTIAREDIDHYYDNAYSEMMNSADVPGFRVGRAPRKLVEARFRKDVKDQIKGSLLMDSLSQVTDEQDLAAISDPDFDPSAVEVPDEGPMTFEFDLEVRPEFDLPDYKGLTIKRPVREFSKDDVDAQLQKMLSERGSLSPHDGAANSGDYITTNLTFLNGDDVLSSSKEETIRIRPVLSFHDGKIEEFDKLMKGVRAGETREGTIKLSDDAPNVELRGKSLVAKFDVLEVKKIKLPELTSEFLETLGGFQDEGELRDAIKDNLQRQLQYEHQQQARKQILSALTVSASWDLPPDLLDRQAKRELERKVLELQRSGFDDEEIQAYENELRQGSKAATAKALKEHFILERIAEDEEIEDTSDDYDLEISLIARQSGQSARRVRAQMEKRGLMDSLRNQIIERKTIDLILAEAKFEDVPFEFEPVGAEAINLAAGGTDEISDIPEAKAEGAS